MSFISQVVPVKSRRGPGRADLWTRVLKSFLCRHEARVTGNKRKQTPVQNQTGCVTLKLIYCIWNKQMTAEQQLQENSTKVTCFSPHSCFLYEAETFFSSPRLDQFGSVAVIVFFWCHKFTATATSVSLSWTSSLWWQTELLSHKVLK